MGWHAALRLDYDLDPHRGRTVARSTHQGPLRVLKALYPEGDAVCHHVLVHPPAGLVSGDVLDVGAQLGAGTHAVLTTPGATRWYRARDPQAGLTTTPPTPATQTVTLRVGPGARVEWLPLETLIYDGALAVNHWHAELAPGAQCLGWDVVALGLPAADAPFTRGWLDQRLTIAGLWREQARIAADDALLLDSPLGLAGRRAMATMWLAWADGEGADDAPTLGEPVIAELLEAARALTDAAGPAVFAGITRAQPRLLVLRAIGERTEPLFALLRQVRGAWRRIAWQMPGTEPRVWTC